MDKYLKIINKILKILFIVFVVVLTVPILYITISGWLSYIFHINILGSNFHEYFAIESSQLSNYQIFWILGQTLFLLSCFISTFLMSKTWWFYYIWSVLIIEFIITNLERLNLTDLYFWVPLIYTIILYLINRRIKKD